MSRFGSRVSWACALSSGALFLLAIGLAAHVRLGLGHWPRPMWEDYRTPAFSIHWSVLIGVAFFALYGAVPLWTLCVALRRLRSSKKAHLVQAAVYLASWGLLAGFCALNPYEFVSWFMD